MIYELLVEYRASHRRADRIVAAILDNLNDRRGIKQELQGCDNDVIKEIFETLSDLVETTR